MIGGFQPGVFQPNYQQASSELIGRRPRRHKTRIYPDWGPEYDFEWLRIQTTIESLQTEREKLKEDISKAKAASGLSESAISIFNELRSRRAEMDRELSRLRMKRLRRERVVTELRRIQQEEDELVLSMIVSYLN